MVFMTEAMEVVHLKICNPELVLPFIMHVFRRVRMRVVNPYFYRDREKLLPKGKSE